MEEAGKCQVQKSASGEKQHITKRDARDVTSAENAQDVENVDAEVRKCPTNETKHRRVKLLDDIAFEGKVVALPSLSVDDVGRVLGAVGLGGYADAFATLRVDGATLVHMRNDDLRGNEIRMGFAEHRERILQLRDRFVQLGVPVVWARGMVPIERSIAPLRVSILKARALLDTQAVGTQTPYAVVHFGDRNARSQAVADGGTDPTWEGATLELEFANSTAFELRVTILNEFMVAADEPIGSCRIDLAQLFEPPTDECDGEDSWAVERFTPRWYDVLPEGALQVAVSMDQDALSPSGFANELMRRRAATLRLIVHRARDIRDTQIFGSQDPYVYILRTRSLLGSLQLTHSILPAPHYRALPLQLC